MNILVFSSNFYPETAAAANRLYGHAKTWVEMGKKVTIITCAPNYPKGNLYPGYKNKFRSVEHINGIKVVRIKSYITANEGKTKRIISYISFGLHACLHGLFEKADIILGTSPQPFNLLPARFVSFVKRKKFIIELRDIWPDSIVAVDAMKKSILLSILEKWIYRLYVKADLIITVTKSFKKHLIDSGIQEKKITVIKNGADFEQVQSIETKQDCLEKYNLPPNKFLAGYIGTLGMAHSIGTIIDAAQLMSNNDHIHFIIMGSGADSGYISDKIKKAKLQNICFIPGGRRAEALAVTKALDIVLVHLKKKKLFKTVIPSKIFEAMMLEKPILIGVDGESREIVESEANCGVFFSPENHFDLANKLKELSANKSLLQALGKNGLKCVENNYDRKVLAKKMLNTMTMLESESG